MREIQAPEKTWKPCESTFVIPCRKCHETLLAVTYRVVGEVYSQSEPCLDHSIRILQLTEPDKQALQLEPSHIPLPKVWNNAYTFNLPLQHHLV